MKTTEGSSEGSAPRAGAARPARGLVITPIELQRLQEQLREAQETLEAIRSGEVDAVVVQGTRGNQVYSLTGAEQPYRVYVERMQEGAVTASADGLILYCNQRFAEMINLPLERAISAQLNEHLPPASWQSLLRIFQTADEVIRHETDLQRGVAEALPVHLAASRLPLEGQEVMCLVVTDLTEQREKGRLQLAKEVAERANAAKDDFLAALSHELRTPLTPALLSARALEQDESIPATLRDEVSLIRRHVELEARLIDDLLDLTRIARNKLELQLATVDVHDVVRQALQICAADAAAKGQTLEVRLEAAERSTFADPVRLQQVVWNLARNAIKFTPPGGTITLRVHNQAHGRICLEVTDTGIGFDAQTRSRIFVAFAQGGRHITQQFGGLGLGLSISRSIIAAHGGELKAESAGPGQGSCFTVALPLQAPPQTASRADAPGSSRAENPAGIRILLVEDHHDTRKVMEGLLRRERHQVLGASTAAEALASAAKQSFDLVISDLGLPDQSGIALMTELRERYGLRGIAVSGYGMEEDVARSRDAGFVFHLTKPIRLDRLRGMIAELGPYAPTA